MNSIFGDATSQMPTPATLAEAESLFSGRGSPIPSLDIRRQQSITADSAIPGLDINPPSPANRPMQARKEPEGLGGWISNLVRRNKDNGEGDSGRYKRVGQDDTNDG